MTIRKDDPCFGVRGRPAKLDKKGFPMGMSPEQDNDQPFNGQCPPGQYIEDQGLSEDVKRIAKLKPKSASSVLASGTEKLD